MTDQSTQESVSTSRIDPALVKTVVRLATPATPSMPASVGTGFLISPPTSAGSSQERSFFLITNKHVVGDWTFADGNIAAYHPTLEMMLYGGVGGAFTPVTIPLLDSAGQPIVNRILISPEPTVDVAAICLDDVLPPGTVPFSHNSFEPSYLCRFDKISSWFVGLGDQVFALGYPRGITSLRTYYPIAKGGYLASIPGEQFAIDVPTQNRGGVTSMVRLDGKFLIVDGLIVPGNSGGPVVLPSELKVRRAPGTNQLQFADMQTQNWVIGIVSMGLGASGLTLVYSSDCILDLVDSFVASLGN